MAYSTIQITTESFVPLLYEAPGNGPFIPTVFAQFSGGKWQPGEVMGEILTYNEINPDGTPSGWVLHVTAVKILGPKPFGGFTRTGYDINTDMGGTLSFVPNKAITHYNQSGQTTINLSGRLPWHYSETDWYLSDHEHTDNHSIARDMIQSVNINEFLNDSFDDVQNRYDFINFARKGCIFRAVPYSFRLTSDQIYPVYRSQIRGTMVDLPSPPVPWIWQPPIYAAGIEWRARNYMTGAIVAGGAVDFTNTNQLLGWPASQGLLVTGNNALSGWIVQVSQEIGHWPPDDALRIGSYP